MSNKLVWRRTPPEEEWSGFVADAFALKKILGPRFWDHDGSLNSESVTLRAEDGETAAYFQGLADAGVEGASELVQALAEHHVIDIAIRE